MIYSAFLPVDDCWGALAALFQRQLIFLLLSWGMIPLIQKTCVEILLSKKVSGGTIALGIVMLLLAYLPFFGVSVNGAQRWISIFGIQFQPSEITKCRYDSFYLAKLF